MATKQEIYDSLKNAYACEESLAWLAAQPDDATPQELWDSCPDVGWIAWLIGNAIITEDLRRRLYLACAAICRKAVAVAGCRIPEDYLLVIMEAIEMVERSPGISSPETPSIAHRLRSAPITNYPAIHAQEMACALIDSDYLQDVIWDVCHRASALGLEDSERLALIREHIPTPPELSA